MIAVKRLSVLDKVNLFILAYARVFALFPRVSYWFPFLVLAIFQSAGLAAFASINSVVWLNVVYPILSKILPPEIFHYPQYFISLPSVFSVFDSFILGPTIWVIASASAVYKLGSLDSGEKAHLKDGFSRAVRRYFPLLLLWIIELAVVFPIVWLPSKTVTDLYRQSPTTQFAANTALQLAAFIPSALLIYAIPGIMVSGRKLFAAIGDSFKLFFHNILLTYLIISVPGLFRLAFDAVLNNFGSKIVWTMKPELIIAILAMKIAAGIFINLLIYGAATIVYKETTVRTNG